MLIKNKTTDEVLEHTQAFPNTSFPNGTPTNEFLDEAGYEVFVRPPTVYTPTNDEIIKNIITGLEYYYDKVAQVKKYDNRVTCTLRAGYAGPFQSEGLAFAIWMDECNAYGYTVMENVLLGLRGIPTISELILELPVPPWELPTQTLG